MQRLPYVNPDDPGYRRLRYSRYADDFLLGFNGPRAEAEEIKRRLGEFLRDTLKLELSQDKTLVTHSRSEAARFLGYEVVVEHNDRKLDHHGLRSLNGTVGLRMPAEVVRRKCADYTRNGKPVGSWAMRHDSVFSIVAHYQTEYRGVVEYYQLATNVAWLGRVKWVMGQSPTKTLAGKLRLSVYKVYRKFLTVVATPDGPRKVLQATVERRDGKPPLVARWGAIPLRRRTRAVLDDQPPRVWKDSRSELERRLLADECELCGSRVDVQVHHIRALKDLQRKGRAERPEWVKVMAARHRKTLVVCQRCHRDIHRGRPRRHLA